MPVEANSVMNTPPPAAANSGPYETVSESVTPQPELSLAVYVQSVPLAVPVKDVLDEMEHPLSV